MGKCGEYSVPVNSKFLARNREKGENESKEEEVGNTQSQAI